MGLLYKEDYQLTSNK